MDSHYRCVCVFWIRIIVQDIRNSSASTREWFGKDLLLTRTLLQCMRTVVEGTDEELETLKRTFTAKEKGANSVSSGSHGAGSSLGALGSAPPTATIQDLVTLRKLRNFVKRVDVEVHVKDDYKALRSELVNALAPIKDLLASHKRRLAALDSRKTAWKNMKEQKFGDIASPTPALISSCYVGKRLVACYKNKMFIHHVCLHVIVACFIFMFFTDSLSQP